MGFHDVKRRVIHCLIQGTYDHEVRRNIDVKNLFQCGQLSEEDVIGLILQTSGNDYEVRPHHKAPLIDVHILKPRWAGHLWYVKFYFVEPDVVFISVHQSGV